jgi:hypothetical protein
MLTTYTQFVATLYRSLPHIIWCPQSVTVSTIHYPVACSNDEHSPTSEVPELSPCLSYQLLTATAHNYWTAVLWIPVWRASHTIPLVFSSQPDKQLTLFFRFAYRTDLVWVPSELLYNWPLPPIGSSWRRATWDSPPATATSKTLLYEGTNSWNG